MVMKALFGLPYVAYCHGEDITQTDKYRYLPHVRNRIYRNADAVVANSDIARQNLHRINVPAERIHKISPGVVAVRFSSAQSRSEIEELYGLQGKLILLTVGRLIPRKGHRLVLRTIAKLCAEIPNLHYLIAGIGSEEQPLRKLAEELGLNDRVTFAGYVPQQRLPALYSACDIMVMPNRQEEDGDIEGFGMVFLEANAAGKAVIGGKSGGAHEAVADGITGFLVNPENGAELDARPCAGSW